MSLEVGIALALAIVPFVIFCIRASRRLARIAKHRQDQSSMGAKRPSR